jgi:hypothetical protein
MTNLTKLEVNTNKAEAVNELHSYLNRVLPLIAERLQKGFKLKTDNTFFAKDKTDLDEILKTDKPKKCWIYLECAYGTVRFSAKTNYMVSDCSCNYVERFGSLFNKELNQKIELYTFPTDLSAEKYAAIELELKEVQKQISELNSKESMLKSALR